MLWSAVSTTSRMQQKPKNQKVTAITATGCACILMQHRLSWIAQQASTSRPGRMSNAAVSITAAAGAVAELAASPSSQPHMMIFDRFGGTPSLIVGSAWVLSSAVLTTYSTTMFLKYQGDRSSSSGTLTDSGGNSKRKQHLSTSASSSRGQLPRKASSAVSTTRHRGILSHHLESIPRPTLLTLFRFGGSLLLGLFLHVDFWRLAPRLVETFELFKSFFFPALFLFVANLTNSIALNRIGISLTYTSKCGIPLMTVLLTLLLDGRKALPHPFALASLLPIAFGIAAASWSSPTFETLGFLAAVISTTSQSALNVSSKKMIAKAGVSGLTAQRVMVTIGFGFTMVTLAMTELLRRWSTKTTTTTTTTTRHPASELMELDLEKSSLNKQAKSLALASSPATLPPVWLSILASTAYHVEYVLSFMFVKLVQPVTYGTCDAIRRLSIILVGRAFFGGAPLTKINMVGIALALIGALCYSIATTVT